MFQVMQTFRLAKNQTRNFLRWLYPPKPKFKPLRRVPIYTRGACRPVKRNIPAQS